MVFKMLSDSKWSEHKQEHAPLVVKQLSFSFVKIFKKGLYDKRVEITQNVIHLSAVRWVKFSSEKG